MALILADDTIEIFERLTRFDFNTYIDDFATFIENDYGKILNYFNGKVRKLDKDAIREFTRLRKLSSILEDYVLGVSVNLDRMDYWNLISFIDEINSRIKVISKIDKFLRVVKYDALKERSMAVEYLSTDFDTPESIAAKDRLNPQDDWVDIYVKNNVLETDYLAEEGGTNLRLGRVGLGYIFIESVVDNLQGDNIYGKDIDKEFFFEDNDIKVLSPKDTIRQSINILAKLQKGDVPEYLGLGVSPDIAIGSNLGLISIPFLTKELKQTFSTDDTLVDFQIVDVKTEGSALFIDYKVRSFLDLIINDNLELK